MNDSSLSGATDSSGATANSKVELPAPDDAFDREHVLAVMEACAAVMKQASSDPDYEIPDVPGVNKGDSQIQRARKWCIYFVQSQLARQGDTTTADGVSLMHHVPCSYCVAEYRAGRMTYAQYVDCTTKPHPCTQ